MNEQNEHQRTLQRADDMLQFAINQRTAAQNECMQLAAALVAAQREAAAYKAENAVLQQRIQELETKPEPQANGVAAEA